MPEMPEPIAEYGEPWAADSETNPSHYYNRHGAYIGRSAAGYEAQRDRAVACVNACAGLPDHALPYGVIPKLGLDSLENALCWFVALKRSDVAPKMNFTDDAVTRFDGMLQELTGAINLCYRPTGKATETADQIEQRCIREATLARAKEKAEAGNE